MKKLILNIISLSVLTALLLTPLQAAGKKEIKETFPHVKKVRIRTMDGNCFFTQANSDQISVHLVYSGGNEYLKPTLKIEGDTLVLKQPFQQDKNGGSVWRISMPEGIPIHSNSISGSFSLEGLDTDVTVRCVSGDISVKNCMGKLSLRTVSGSIDLDTLDGHIDVTNINGTIKGKTLAGTVELKSTKGFVDLEDLGGDITVKSASSDIKGKKILGTIKMKSSSGDIKLTELTVKGPSSFKVASGDVELALAATPIYDLSLASANGLASLNYKGNPIKGTIKFRILGNSGEITSPFPFDNESEEVKWGKTFMVKTVKKDSGSPKIELLTATGQAVLKEK